jgi:hypothetical protein
MTKLALVLSLEARRLREENALLQAKLAAVEAVLREAEERCAGQLVFDPRTTVSAIRNALTEPERVFGLLSSSSSEPEPPYIARSGGSLTRPPSGSDSGQGPTLQAVLRDRDYLRSIAEELVSALEVFLDPDHATDDELLAGPALVLFEEYRNLDLPRRRISSEPRVDTDLVSSGAGESSESDSCTGSDSPLEFHRLLAIPPLPVVTTQHGWKPTGRRAVEDK